MKRLLICKNKVTYRRIDGKECIEKIVELGEQTFFDNKILIKEMAENSLTLEERRFLLEEDVNDEGEIDFIDNVLETLVDSKLMIDVVIEKNNIRKKFDDKRIEEEKYFTVVYNIVDTFTNKSIANEFMVFGSLEKDAMEKTLRKIRSELEWYELVKVKCSTLSKKWVFSPSVAGFLFHEGVGHLLEEEQFRVAGFKVGDKLFNAPINIFENWKNQNEFDDFGVPIKKDICVLREGEIENVLSADLNGGSGNACTQEPFIQPITRMNSMFVTTASKVNNIFDGIEDGIYFDEITTGEFNPINGEIGLSVTKAKKIVDGKLECAYEPMMILFNIGDLVNCNIALDGHYDKVMSLCGKLGAAKKIEYTVPRMLIDWSKNGKFITDRNF